MSLTKARETHNPSSMMKTDDQKAKSALFYLLQDMGLPDEILGPVGAWGDTMNDAEVARALDLENRRLLSYQLHDGESVCGRDPAAGHEIGADNRCGRPDCWTCAKGWGGLSATHRTIRATTGLLAL